MRASRHYALSLVFAATALAGGNAAWAHAALQSASPAKDAEVTNAPREIILQFNEKLEAAFSSAKLSDSSGREVSSAKATLDASNPSVMRLAIPALAAGTYKVEYVGVGHDGHRRKGNYVFNVK